MNEKIKKLFNLGVDSLKKAGKKVKEDIEIELKKADIKELEAKIGKIVYKEKIDTKNDDINSFLKDIKKKQEEINKLKKKEKEEDD